jgi:hypothetical protein
VRNRGGMADSNSGRPERRSHQREHLGGDDVAWTFEPLYNSPSEWNLTARWMDYSPETSPPYDILDAMLVADEVRWRAAEMIALLHLKSRTPEQVRRALTLGDGIRWIARVLDPPRYGKRAGNGTPEIAGETKTDCLRIASLADRINRAIRKGTNGACELDDAVAHAQIPPLSELGELARTLYMRWYHEAGYGRS